MQSVLTGSQCASGTPVLVLGSSATSGLSLLDRCGFSATACPDGRVALKLLQRGHHQAILCDLNISGTGGKALLKSVCADFPIVAVVVVTPPAKLRHGLLAMISGASGYIRSPLQPESMAASLCSALKRKQLDTAARQWNLSSSRDRFYRCDPLPGYIEFRQKPY